MSDGAARHARLTALFADAIERDRAGQAAILAAARAEDPALADELASLLAVDDAHEAAAGATAGRDATAAMYAVARTHAMPAMDPTVATGPPAATGPAATGATAPTAGGRGGVARFADHEAAPLVIPGFVLGARLGEGGMGTVWAAEQRAPRRPVAIKVLRAASSAALARFAAEAEIMARLDHPGIARVLEAGQVDGHPYLAMERIDGVPLDVHVRTAAPPRAERLRLFAALCDAVHHAHVKGVIHRDLKPANVMVRASGGIAVLDFGIARVADGDTPSDATRAGDLMGTPSYMSPEQARLRPDEVDARSDVYALGVILYELVSGALPHDVRGRALPDVLQAIVDEPPRPLGRHDPSLRGDLEAIADRALRKEPSRRYASAAALADDVRRHLEGASISARVPGLVEQTRRFARRRPGTAAAIAGAGLGIAGFAIAVTALLVDARAARRAADDARTRAEAARLELERRGNRLVLDRARAALADDPTEAARWLATLTPPATDVTEAWRLAERALGHGVAAAVIAAHDDEVRSIEPVPGGGGAAVSAGYDGLVRRWDARGGDGTIVARAPSGVRAALPSADGALLAIGHRDGVVEVVDTRGATNATTATTAITAVTAGHAELEALAWSPDGTWLAGGDKDGRVWRWQRGASGTSSRGATELRDAHPTREVETVVIADDGAVLAGDAAGGVWRWDAGGVAAHVGTTRGAALAVWTDGTVVRALGETGTLHRWRLDDTSIDRAHAAATGAPLDGLVVDTALACRTGAFSADGTFAILGGTSGAVLRVTGEHAVAGDPIEPLAAHTGDVRAIAIDRGSHRFATGGEDGVVRVWDPTTGRRWTLRGHRRRVRHVAFAAGGTQLWSGDSAGGVRRWALDDVWPTIAPDPSRGSGPIDHLARTTDGTLVSAPAGPLVARAAGRVATADAAGRITVRDGARPSEPMGTAGGNTGGTEAIALSPDGAWLASGGQDRVVRAWRTAALDASPIELGPIDDDTRAVAFAPAGDWLVTAGDDGRVLAWRVTRDAIAGPARVLATHPSAVTAFAFDRTGRAVVSQSRDGLLLRADLDGAPTVTVPAPRPPPVPAAVAVVVAAASPEAPSFGGLDGVTAALLLPDGTIAAGTAEGTLRFHRPHAPDLAALHAALAAIAPR